LELVSEDLINWTRKYIQKNGIYFPHLDSLLLRLIFCMVPINGFMLEETDEYTESMEDLAYVSRVKNLLNDVLKGCNSHSISIKTGDDSIEKIDKDDSINQKVINFISPTIE